ncbi:MAG: DUF6152 family protein [Rhodospirillaceae bacterium]|nr:DUF6152 family protein [Rhodospirillaceae bacterium]
MPVRAMVLVVTGWLMGMPVWAHHSHANYDMTQYHHVEGTVTDIHWINPHIWLYVEVIGEEGAPQVWALETANPVQLAVNGVTRDTVRVGDTISARCHQLRDGSNGCLLGYLTGRDGIERLWD